MSLILHSVFGRAERVVSNDTSNCESERRCLSPRCDCGALERWSGQLLRATLDRGDSSVIHWQPFKLE